MELFYRESGAGKPFIIMHGLFGSSDNWLTVTKTLAETHHIFLIDQRNHGRSPFAEEHTYEAMAKDLKDFIAQHKLEKPIVLGHSMGGKTAMKFATTYPDLLEKLVVVDIAPRFYAPHHQTILAGLASVDLTHLQNRVEADAQMASVISDFGTRQFLLKNLYRNDEGIFGWRMNLDFISKEINNIGEGLSDGAIYNGETLFIRGEKSNYITDTDFDDMEKFFPNYILKTVKNAGHWVQAEQPADFLAALEGFI